MKKVALAAAVALLATTANAGQYDGALMDPEVIVADTVASNGGILVPITAIIFALVAVTN